MAITRSDRYSKGFNPNWPDARHIENVLSPDVHKVTLAGNHEDIGVIVTALTVLAAETRKNEALGIKSEGPFASHVEKILAAVATPEFAEHPEPAEA